MSQATLVILDGTGQELLDQINAANQAMVTEFYGSTDPATAGYTKGGEYWRDNGNMLYKQRNVANDAWITKGILLSNGTIQWSAGAFDTSYLPLTGGTLTGNVTMSGASIIGTAASVASAATVDLSAVAGDSVTITGTTAITSLGTLQAGAVKHLTFASALTLMYNSTSMILPGAADITTAAGDTADAESLGGGNWRIRNYQRADGTAVVNKSSGVPDLNNYIVSGRKFTVGSDLNLAISAGADYIANTTVSREENILALTASRAQLIYDTKAGATGATTAAFPTADSGTIGRWIIDGSATISNSAVGENSIAVANDLTKSGTVSQAAGWANDYAGKGDGSSGSYTGANSTNFPTGSSTRALVAVFTYHTSSASQMFGGYGASTANYQWDLGADSSSNLLIYKYGSSISSYYILEDGKTYYVEANYDGTNVSFYVNSALVAVAAAGTVSTTGANLLLYKDTAGAYYSPSTLHYFEVRNTLRTASEIAAISNALLLPYRYYTSQTDNTYTDIRDILPDDSIALGFVRTGADALTDYNDSDYKYGRREGAVGGNRRVFLDWQYFSSAGSAQWDNPFGTEKVSIKFVAKSALTDSWESLCWGRWVNGSTNYGLSKQYVSPFSIYTSANSGGVGLSPTGSYLTTGYFGCYAEVLE